MYEREEPYNVYNPRHQWQDSFVTFIEAVDYIKSHICESDWAVGLWSIEDNEGNSLDYRLN